MTCDKPGCDMPTEYECPSCEDNLCFMCRLPPTVGYCNKRCARSHGQTELFTEDAD